MLKITLIGLIALSVVGCVSTPRIKSLQPISAELGIPIESIKHWQLNARIAIKTLDNNGTASLKWQQNDENFDFLVTGAFGVTGVHLIQTEKGASLKIPDHPVLHDRDAQFLLDNSLGWHFPIHALAFWVKGEASGIDGEQIDYYPSGRIKQIQLEQWTINFSKYSRFNGYDLPKRVDVKHPQLALKVLAKKWSFFHG